MPKSSSAMATPSDLSSARVALLLARSCISRDSVNSSSRLSGAKPVSSSTFLIVLATFSCRNCLLERLTETGIRGNPRPYRAFIWLHAVRNTHSPIEAISPVSSAIGMNCAGATMPYSG